MKQLLLIAAILICFSGRSSAQESSSKPFVLGETREIYSQQLAEKRILNIYLPEGYSKDSTYPVLYLLDGSANEDFVHIVGLMQFFNMIQMVPPTIVVGIGNIDRKRDFTFPTTIAKDKADYPTTGSSGKFISFVEKDLQPYIESQFKTNGVRTVIGQSLGGLVATEILLKKPELFTNYIIVSPSLWWDHESLLKSAPQLLNRNKAGKKQVYLAVGAEGKVMENDAKQLAAILQQPANKNIKLHFDPLKGENHLTILHYSVYRAFRVPGFMK
ncbi:alpha/beta hydrolase [Chitinophagaceae bacterium MMS25-I14]